MPRLVLVCFACLSLAASACGAPSAWVRVQPIDAYRGYDDFRPDQDKAVLARASTVDVSVATVRIFQEAFPEGITLTQGAFGVTPGYQHHLIGKFAYSPGKAVGKAELVARVKKLAVAAGGDAAILIFLATDPKDFDVAQGVEAIIVKLDPRMAPGAAPPPGPRGPGLGA